MPIPLFILGLYAAKKLFDYITEEEVNTEIPIIVEDAICFVGKTSSGKSSTANALLGYNSFKTGIEHGSTSQSYEIDYKEGYKILDTPGLMDEGNQEEEAIYWAKRSKIVIYVTDGQLYQEELEFIENLIINYLRDNILLLYVNKSDEKENFMTKADRQKEKRLIIKQVSEIISKEHIAFGAAAPKEKGKDLKPRIEELENLINKFL